MALPAVRLNFDHESMLLTYIAVAVWSLSGIAIALVVRRNGHDFLTFLGLGIAYGPLVVVFLFEESRRSSTMTLLQAGGPVNAEGWVDVLVGVDETEESRESVKSVVQMLGPSIRRLRLASVVDFEVANKPGRFTSDEDAVASLKVAAKELGYEAAEIVLLSGRADEALVDHALEQQMDLVVVAHRRHYASAALLGSTVARLARDAEMPVPIGPPPAKPIVEYVLRGRSLVRRPSVTVF